MSSVDTELKPWSLTLNKNFFKFIVSSFADLYGAQCPIKMLHNGNKQFWGALHEQEFKCQEFSQLTGSPQIVVIFVKRLL